MPRRHTREGDVQLYSFLTSALNGGEWSTPDPGALPPVKSPDYPRVGVGGYREEKTSRPHRVSNPEPPSPQRIATATTQSPQPAHTHDVTDVARSSYIILVTDNFFCAVLRTAVQSSIAQIAHAPKRDCACSCTRKHIHLEGSRARLSMYVIYGVNTSRCLCPSHEAQKGNGGIDPLILNLGSGGR